MRIREIAIGIVLSGLLAGGVALTIPTPEQGRSAVPAARAIAPVSVSPAAPAPPAARPAAAVPAAPEHGVGSWRDMHAKFVRAPSLRVFFYQAMRHPGEGAFYYAMNALQTCRLAMRAALDLPAPRREAAAQLRERCDFTPQGLEDAERELHATRGLAFSADALLGSMFDYLAADGVEGRAAVLRAAFDQGNPEVIASLVASAVSAGIPAASRERDSTARGVPFGTMLVACRLGADCGAGGIRTLELCVQQGWCADSIPAALQQGLGEHYAAIDQVAARVVRDVRRGDARALAPPQ